MTSTALALLITARVSCMPCDVDGSGGCKWSWFLPGRATPVTASKTFRAPSESSCKMASAHLEHLGRGHVLELPATPDLSSVDFLKARWTSRSAGWCQCARLAANEVLCESASTWSFFTPSGAQAFGAKSPIPGGPNYGTFCFRKDPSGNLVPRDCPANTEALLKARCEGEAGLLARLFDGAEFR